MKIDPIIEQLRATRISKGMTQRDVAERMWTRRDAVAHFENDGRSPLLDTVQRYAEAVGAKIAVVTE